MTQEEKKAWLERILKESELQDHYETFIKNDLLEKEVLATLTDADLEKIGIDSLGSRRKLITIFAKFNTETTPTTEEKKGKGPWVIVGWLLVIVLVIAIIGGLGL